MLLLGRSILNLHTSRFNLRSVVVVVLFIEQPWTFLAGWVFMHKGFAFRRRFGVSSYAVLIRVYVQMCDSFVYQERLGVFESLIIKMRDFDPVEYIYFLFVGQRELLGTDLHGLGGYL